MSDEVIYVVDTPEAQMARGWAGHGWYFYRQGVLCGPFQKREEATLAERAFVTRQRESEAPRKP